MVNIRKVVQKTIKYTNGNINYINMEKYAEHLGYSIVLYNTPVGDTELARHNKLQDAQKVSSFTLHGVSRIIFIDNNVAPEDKLYLLLHEVGHIAAGHLDGKMYTRNIRITEFEADVYAYELLNYSKLKRMFILAMAGFIICATVLLGHNLGKIGTIKEKQIDEKPPAQVQFDTGTKDEAEKGETVYVTPSGRKYHRKDCFYIKGRSSRALTVEEAADSYSPCAACRP